MHRISTSEALVLGPEMNEYKSVGTTFREPEVAN
ncbi:hypothetical protein EYZ11_007598 [Aspergillus tanneri]|uniref:Uncharacterized protein n=1 Tax=Aspergillus tanneri TaxID=1220188 RepID=A0A4S3JEW3_9EURO|nr:hypothetical protein EYZ11_007598 [Aspergillus tanneri]